jgi:hypothetical protein
MKLTVITLNLNEYKTIKFRYKVVADEIWYAERKKLSTVTLCWHQKL